jgi:hypothetical protein
MRERYFPQQPNLDSTGDRKKRRLEHDFIGRMIHGKRTTVREGFITDGASIPRIAWSIVGHPFQEPLKAAAILHDAEYAAKLYTRKECDERFYLAMRELGIRWTKSRIIWLAVRSGGWMPWKKYTVESIQKARKLVECE